MGNWSRAEWRLLIVLIIVQGFTGKKPADFFARQGFVFQQAICQSLEIFASPDQYVAGRCITFLHQFPDLDINELQGFRAGVRSPGIWPEKRILVVA